MNLTKMLIPAAIILLTGWRSPAYCQPEPITAEANVGEGWGHGFARTWTADPSCVYENVGHPFSGLRGFGDVHEHGDCSNPELYHHHSFGTNTCWLESWDLIPGESIESQLDIFSCSLAWSPEGVLQYVNPRAADGFNPMGRWATPIPMGQFSTPQPTWNQFVSGTPIVTRAVWLPAGDVFFFPYVQTWEERGEGFPSWEVWQILYDGHRPWECDVEVVIECLELGLRFAPGGEMVFGGRFRLTCTPVLPLLPTDLTQDGVAGVDDLFLFLEYWFAGYLRADWTRDDIVEANDIFAYLTDWFAQ